jgi:hypothetical protein
MIKIKGNCNLLGFLPDKFPDKPWFHWEKVQATGQEPAAALLQWAQATM